MSLQPNQTLSHYRIVSKLGEGGMGVVWRAVDTTLDREVAIKVLPAEMANQPDRLSRFEREAKLLASLNHPNIAGIHGIHSVDGTLFLAMELVEGQDLQERLAGGAMTLKQTLQVALQIAHAFEAAHESGVIHRDLKPANVKLTTGGVVKVLDFGLAKALADPTQPGGSASMSPTMTSAGTMAGMIMGTAAYMSPEQAKAKEVDRRADIWSFGVVLFEMLSGRRLFEGEGISETLAAVIMKDVDWGSLPSSTPPRIRRLLERCLERDPKLRLRDIGDARITLEEVLRNPEEQLAAAPAAPRRRAWPVVLPWGIASLAFAWAFVGGGGEPTPAPTMRFTMALSGDQPLDNSPRPMLAVSPDGERIAYVGDHNGADVLYLRLTREHEALMLPGTEDAAAPFFSPDGQWIGFGADGKLKKVSVLGGPPATLCDAPDYRGGSWGDDGTIVFAPQREGALFRVPDAGGSPQPLTTLGAPGDSTRARTHRWPQVLPGSGAVVFTYSQSASGFGDAGVAVFRPGDERPTTLATEAFYGRFVPPGFLVYARESTIFAARFDPERLELTGPAVPVLEDVHGADTWGSKHLAFSDRGLLAYLRGASSQTAGSLAWVDRAGNELPASSHLRQFEGGDISPSGTHLAFEIGNAGGNGSDIWILELERDTLTRLTFDEASDGAPIWSADGEWITFNSDRHGGVPNLYRKRANGTGEVERLTTSDNLQWPNHWSPDGQVLAFGEIVDGQAGNLMLYRPGADPEVETFLATPYWEWGMRFSPDGRWVVYSSAESGQGEVYLRPFDGSGGQTKISTSLGREAAWAGPDELIYRVGDELMSVALAEQGGTVRPALPQLFSELPIPPWNLRFRVSPDGERVLMVKSTDSTSSNRDPVVVVNWVDELEAKVPAAR